MVRLHELIDILSKKNDPARTLAAKKSRTCKICGRPAVDFHSMAAKLEYKISSICETCQEYYYLSRDNN